MSFFDPVLFDPVLFDPGAVTFPADAVLLANESSSFSANAVIKASRSSSFPADAYVAHWFHADAVIFKPSGFSVDAVILSLVFLDTFNRVVPQGLGNQWVWYPSIHFPSIGPDTAIAFVNGTEAVLPINADGQSFESYTGLPFIARGWVQFDFFVPADTTAFAQIDVTAKPDQYSVFGEGDGTWGAAGVFTANVYIFTPAASTWYTVRFQVGLDPAHDRVKVWKRGDPVPTTWFDLGATTGHETQALLDLYSTDAEAGRATTLAIWTIESPWAFTGALNAQAFIILPRAFTVDAVIYPKPFSANAIIKRTIGNVPSNPIVVDYSSASGSSTTSLILTTPATPPIVGDLLIAAVSFDAQGNPSADISTATPGWSRVARDMVPNGDQGLVTYVGVGTEVGGITFTSSPARAMAAVMLLVRGAEAVAYLTSRNVDIETLVHPTSSINVDPTLLRQLLVYFWSESEPGTGSYGYGTGWLNPSPELTFVDSVARTFASILAATEVVPVGTALGTRQFSFTGQFGNDTPTQVQTLIFAPSSEAFTVDAIVRANNIPANAVLRATQLGKVDLSAFIAHTFRVSAWIGGSKTFTVDAVLRPTRTGSFTVSAAMQNAGGAKGGNLTVAAAIRRGGSGSFYLDASLWFSATFTGSFSTNAWVVGSKSSFPADAQISSPSTPTGSFAANAVVSNTYRHTGFSANAMVRTPALGKFDADAVIASQLPVTFSADAVIARNLFTADAFIARTFTVSAVIGTVHVFSANAAIKANPRGLIVCDAVIASRGQIPVAAVIRSPVQPRGLPLIALLRLSATSSFSASAWLAGRFTVDAFIRPTFRVDAFISDAQNVKFFPPGGGPPINPVTGGPYNQPDHAAQVEILIRRTGEVVGTDITGIAIVTETSFTQAERTQPGSFTLTLDGYHLYVGGEEVLVNIDGLRQYGGIVVSCAYAYETDAAQAKTILSGLDFNCLFDRIVIWNAEKYTGSTGPYDPIPDLPADSYDDDVILAYWSRFIDEPWKRIVDVHRGAPDLVGEIGRTADGVDRLSIVNPHVPFIFESGGFMREFMSTVSMMTNGIWWIDPYYTLQYHRRSNATAPYAITDGDDGINCQNLKVEREISELADDVMVWGTLAQTVAGEVITDRVKNEDSIAKYGTWQAAEYHSELHVQAHVTQRAESVVSRIGSSIHHVTATIFENGFQAGQVATVRSARLGIDENIPIRQITLTFPVSQGEKDGKFYAQVRYDLALGVEPDAPWSFMDNLPFENIDVTSQSYTLPGLPRFQLPYLQLWNSSPTRGTVDPCLDEPTPFLIFRDDFDRPISDWRRGDWGDGGYGRWYVNAGRSPAIDLNVPPPWCITVAVDSDSDVHLGNQNFDVFASFGEVDISVASQQFSFNGLFNVNTYGKTLRFDVPDESLPFFLRIRRLVGYAEVSIWPQNGSMEPVTWSFNVPNEVTMWPDPTLVVSSANGLCGISVAAGAAQGVIWNDPTADNPAVPPNTVLITQDGSSGSGPIWLDLANSWQMNYYTGNPSIRSGPPPRLTDANNVIADTKVDWSTAVPVAPAGQPYVMALDSLQMQWLGVDLRYFVSGLQVSGRNGFHLTNSSLGLHVDLNMGWDVGFGSYSGGLDLSPPSLGIAGGVVPISATLIFGGNAVSEWYNSNIPFGAGLHQFMARMVSPQYFPSYTNFLGFGSIAQGTQGPYWAVSWQASIDIADKSPLGEICACENGTDPVFQFGFGSESALVAKDGTFHTRLPTDYNTMEVYSRGKLLIPQADWQTTDTSGLNHKIVTTSSRCVRVIYLASPNVVATQLPTPRNTTTNVAADRVRFGAQRPL